MASRFLNFSLTLAFGGVALTPLLATAEFRCSADVSYKWVRTAVETPSVSPKTAKAPEPPAKAGKAGEKGKGAPAAEPEAAASPTEVAPEATPAVTVVRLMGIERSGADEASAKEALEVEAGRQRIKASDLCRRDHESVGSCIAQKLNGRSSTLNSLDFKTRAEVEKALSEECRQQQGSCQGVEVSEPKCRQISSSATVPTPATAPVAEKKADTKKK
jgi:hypothetical protein